MDVTIRIPDDIAGRLGAEGDLPRRALEALAVQEFRFGRLTKGELRELLGFATRQALDGFLKARDVYIPFTLDDLEQDRNDLDRLGGICGNRGRRSVQIEGSRQLRFMLLPMWELRRSWRRVPARPAASRSASAD